MYANNLNPQQIEQTLVQQNATCQQGTQTLVQQNATCQQGTQTLAQQNESNNCVLTVDAAVQTSDESFGSICTRYLNSVKTGVSKRLKKMHNTYKINKCMHPFLIQLLPVTISELFISSMALQLYKMDLLEYDTIHVLLKHMGNICLAGMVSQMSYVLCMYGYDTFKR